MIINLMAQHIDEKQGRTTGLADPSDAQIVALADDDREKPAENILQKFSCKNNTIYQFTSQSLHLALDQWISFVNANH